MTRLPVYLLILTVFVCSGAAFGQTTAFTYQGRLTDTNIVADGSQHSPTPCPLCFDRSDRYLEVTVGGTKFEN